MSGEYTNEHPHIKSEDIANCVKYIISQPKNVNVRIREPCLF